MAHFTGMFGYLLPLPGGVGGVEGGMIGAFLAFDVAGGLAVVAGAHLPRVRLLVADGPRVLAYRA